MTNALALDTTSDALSLAVMKDGEPAASHYAPCGPVMSQRIFGEIEHLLGGLGLQPGALDVLVVARGPGSFTGTRIGMGVALTFAQVLGRPVIGVDTLHLLASQVEPQPGVTYHALLNCARDEVYHAPFRWDGALPEAQDEIRLTAMSELRPRLADGPVVLRRFPRYTAGYDEAFAGLQPMPLRHPLPDGLRLLALGVPRYLAQPEGPFEPVTPIYLKSEAFRKWKPQR